MFESIFAAIQTIPIFDKWAERLFQSYREWKLNKALADSVAAINEAKTGETGDLNQDIGSKT